MKTAAAEWKIVEETDKAIRLCYQKPGIFSRTGKPYSPVYMTVTRDHFEKYFVPVRKIEGGGESKD